MSDKRNRVVEKMKKGKKPSLNTRRKKVATRRWRSARKSQVTSCRTNHSNQSARVSTSTRPMSARRFAVTTEEQASSSGSSSVAIENPSSSSSNDLSFNGMNRVVTRSMSARRRTDANLQNEEFLNSITEEQVEQPGILQIHDQDENARDGPVDQNIDRINLEQPDLQVAFNDEGESIEFITFDPVVLEMTDNDYSEEIKKLFKE